MTQKQVILTYGKVSDIPQGFDPVDVTDIKWANKIPDSGKVLCHKSAYVYVIKFLPPGRIARTIAEIAESSNEKELEKQPTENRRKISAITTDKAVVSARYNKEVENRKVWLSPNQVKMISKILGSGCKVTLLDEDNNIIEELENV